MMKTARLQGGGLQVPADRRVGTPAARAREQMRGGELRGLELPNFAGVERASTVTK